MKRFVKTAISSLLLVGLLGCANHTSPTGRGQMLLHDSAKMDLMGKEAFAGIKQKEKISTNKRTNRYVQCISDALINELSTKGSWETVVFESDMVNAFALPGGYIGVYTGLIKLAKNQDQLAAVMGHEIAHVLAQHGNEKISRAQLTQGGLQLAGGIMEASGVEDRDLYMGALSAGAQLGILLPYGRTQETEADVMGAELMAKAGFNPKAAASLWREMAKLGGKSGPEFMSTHPSHDTRISELTQLEARLYPLYQRAKQQGKRPNCQK